MQRQAALQIPLGAGDFRSVQASTDANLDAFCAETQSRIDRLAHRAPESNALLQLHCDRLGDELGVQLGPVNLLNIDIDLAAGAFLNVELEFVDFRAFASNDDSGPR